MKRHADAANWAVDYNPDDEQVERYETGHLTVRELAESYGLQVHDLFSTPSNPFAYIGFASRSEELGN